MSTWTKTEIAILRACIKEGMTGPEIHRQIPGRSVDAIYSKVTDLGETLRTESHQQMALHRRFRDDPSAAAKEADLKFQEAMRAAIERGDEQMPPRPDAGF